MIFLLVMLFWILYTLQAPWWMYLLLILMGICGTKD
jgi:hypothetical protein|nr:MAG TPA: Sporulation protein YhaL [Bacteriophage sp.]DAM96717.1 MAG TPA: Sporulation protein YhaL [Bacteriophage sp.]